MNLTSQLAQRTSNRCFGSLGIRMVNGFRKVSINCKNNGMSVASRWSPCEFPKNRCFCLVLTLLLSGCATMQDCDPRQDPGIFGSINRHGSDCYSKRIDTQKQMVGQAQAEKQALLDELRGTQTTSGELDIEIQQAEAELDDMDRQVKSLQSELKRTHSNNSSLASRLSSLQTRIGTLKADVKKGGQNKKEFEKAQQKLKQSQQELDILKRDILK